MTMKKPASHLALAGLVLGSALVPFSASQAATPSYCPKDGPVRFGVEPWESPKILLPAYKSIGHLLSKKLGCPVKIEITDNYTAEIEAMRHGKLEAGEFGPFGDALAQKVAGAKTVAQFADADGKPRTYWASVVTWQGSGIKNLQDVQGKTFIFSDPASTSGHLMPSYALKQAGINPKTGIQAFYAGSHTNSFQALLHHKAKAGELNSETVHMAKNHGWWKQTNFTTLWRSQPLPLDAIAISPKANKELQQRMTHILQHLKFGSSLSAAQQKVMGKKAQMVPANNNTYAYIQKVMNTMNITMKDL